MADYNFYKDTYKGKLTKEEFETYAVRANSVLESYENRFTVTYFPDEENSKKMAICSLVDEVAKTVAATGDSANNVTVKSVSVGSVSTSFDSISAESVIKSEKSRYSSAIKMYAHIYRGVKQTC